MTRLANPVPLYLDGRGALLDAGYIYIGQPGTDPAIVGNRLDLFWDIDQTISAAQPLRTLGGVIVNGGDLGFVYFSEIDYSILVLDADQNLVHFVPTALDLGSGASFQTQADILDDISALAGTAFGLGLLELADAAGLRGAAGLGTSALLDEATIAQYRANTPDKVLTTDQVWGAASYVPLSQSGGNVAVDLSSGINFTLAMTATPWTLSNPTNGKAGQSGVIEITQDSNGSRVLNFGSAWKFVGGTDPVLSTVANSKDLLFYEVLADGASIYATLAKAIA